jgi:hypothetical protein
MKLKDLLNENEEANVKIIEEWLKHWQISTFCESDSTTLNGTSWSKIFDKKTMRMYDEFTMLSVTSIGHQTFSWPFSKDLALGFELDIFSDTKNSGAVIENFKDFPQVQKLIFGRNLEIKSLEGIENLKVFDIDFEVMRAERFGLLRLLKSKTLEHIKPVAKVIHPGMHDAMEIVNKHLKGDRDIAECMDELIAEGLKEYAKL